MIPEAAGHVPGAAVSVSFALATPVMVGRAEAISGSSGATTTTLLVDVPGS